MLAESVTFTSSFPEPPLFWAAPALDVPRSRSGLRLQAIIAAPAPDTNIFEFEL